LLKHIILEYIKEIKQILSQARQKTYQAINSAMVEAYWKIGERIVLEEQNGKDRADYGKAIIKNISNELTLEFGKGFSERSIREYRQFYQMTSDIEIWRTVFAKLQWSHFQRVLRVSDPNAQKYYLQEAADNMWSVRTLDRNISTLYYQRLLSSQVKEPVKTQEYLDEVMEYILDNPKNKELLEHSGTKGGSTAFVLTKALYTTDKKGNKTELVYFLNNLTPFESIKLQTSMNI
jgi:hypothetical protein